MNPNKSSEPAKTEATTTVPDWMTETINDGSFPLVDLHTGIDGWAIPPGDVFSLRSVEYFKNRKKSPGGDSLLSTVGVDWLKTSTKLHNVMARPDNRVAHALRKSQSRGESQNSFIFAVNLQVSGNSVVMYFATEEPIPSDSPLQRLIHGDDSFRNQRFKMVSKVIKGPSVVKAVAGSFGAFVVGKSTKCNYYRGSNYFEIDIDLTSSKILTVLLRLLLRYITYLKTDIGFVVEAQTEDELPEKLIGAVRICHMELSSAFLVEDQKKPMQLNRMMGSAKADDEEDEVVD